MFKTNMFPPSQTASGVRQKDIAEKVGLSERSIRRIIPESGQNVLVTEITSSDLTVTAKLKDEVESLRRKLEEAEAARRSTEQRLSAVQSDLKTAKMVIETAPKNAERDKEFLRNKLKEEQERHDAERGGSAPEGHRGEGGAGSLGRYKDHQSGCSKCTCSRR